MNEERATAALEEARIDYTLVRHGPVNSLVEAAQLRAVCAPGQVVKTLVVRRGKDEYLFVLVPGDRQISWPQLRTLLDVTRLSMPNAETARAVTGYGARTITPFASSAPVACHRHSRVQGSISIGAGAHGVSAMAAAADVIEALSATVADVTAPQALTGP